MFHGIVLPESIFMFHDIVLPESILMFYGIVLSDPYFALQPVHMMRLVAHNSFQIHWFENYLSGFSNSSKESYETNCIVSTGL